MALRTEYEDAVAVEEEAELKPPDDYRVVLLNDDYTPMDFVVEILMGIFHKPMRDATRIMLDVHIKGRGIVGVYTYDLALTKCQAVRQAARERGFPLSCVMERA